MLCVSGHIPQRRPPKHHGQNETHRVLVIRSEPGELELVPGSCVT